MSQQDWCEVLQGKLKRPFKNFNFGLSGVDDSSDDVDSTGLTDALRPCPWRKGEVVWGEVSTSVCVRLEGGQC